MSIEGFEEETVLFSGVNDDEWLIFCWGDTVTSSFNCALDSGINVNAEMRSK